MSSWPRILGIRHGILVATILLASLLAAGAASAEGEKIQVDVLVTHVSQKPASDLNRLLPKPGADSNRLRQKLQQHTNLKHFELLKRESLHLDVDEVGTVDLPNGKRVHVRPLSVTEGGVLLAVAFEGGPQMDVKARRNKLLVVGGDSYEDGRLVVSLEVKN